MIPALCAASITLASLVAPTAGAARSSGYEGQSPANAGPPPPPARIQAPDRKPLTKSQAAGAPFVTHALALARGHYARACAQLSKVVLRKVRVRSLREARKVCVKQLRSATGDLDRGRLRSLASTRVVRVRFKNRRARVTVQTTLYGLEPRATGTAIREDGRWKIAKVPSGAHVGRSLVERIPSESMFPTLGVGDTILVDQDSYLKTPPAIGDIVVFHPPASAVTARPPVCAERPPRGQACAKAHRRDAKEQFVKRIVAGPGDRISIRDGHVIRNGTPASESFIRPCGEVALRCDFPRTLTVTAGRYYVLGDNRGESYDSRYWGPVAAASIVGRARRVGP